MGTAIAFLASDATWFVTVPGVHVDGGWTTHSFTQLAAGHQDPG
jgi:hypothetical protein